MSDERAVKIYDAIDEARMRRDLPRGPFSYETVRAMKSTHEGAGHVYILDGDGRKIASMWGKPDEKMALAALIIEARKAQP